MSKILLTLFLFVPFLVGNGGIESFKLVENALPSVKVTLNMEPLHENSKAKFQNANCKVEFSRLFDNEQNSEYNVRFKNFDDVISYGYYHLHTSPSKVNGEYLLS